VGWVGLEGPKWVNLVRVFRWIDWDGCRKLKPDILCKLIYLIEEIGIPTSWVLLPWIMNGKYLMVVIIGGW